jgi:hypothetical protein
VDASDRLAALLAGELDADERLALEAELARDPELRADLSAMERADEHLAELRSPEPPAGFEQRLDDRLAATLTEVLGAPDTRPHGGGTATSTTVAAGDVFTARRRDRASRRMQTMIGVAAAAVVLVGSGVLFTSFGGDDTADESAMFETMDADDGATDESDAAAEGAFVTDGPVVVADGRTLDDDAIDELLTSGELDLVASQGYDESLGRDVAERFQSDLGARSTPDGGSADLETDEEIADTPETEDAPDEGSADDRDQDVPAGEVFTGRELVTRDGTSLPATDAADVTRCLDEVLGGDPDAIPAYVELAGYQDTEVVVLGLVTLDPETDTFARNEVWVLDRATCQLLRFSQS